MAKKILAFSILCLFAFISVWPVLSVLSISFRPVGSLQTKDISIYEAGESFVDANNNGVFDPGESFEDSNNNGRYDEGSSFKNYTNLFTDTLFLTWAKNSILVSLVVTLTGMVLAASSGYALSRFKFAGKKWLLISIMTTQMFPATMLLLPFFIVLSKLELINSYIGLFVIYSSTVLPFCVWQMKGYYDTIPKELEEAARMDGCSQFVSFYKIILPLAAPALVITALFSFMASWSEYMVAAVVLQDPEIYTLPLGLKQFQASMATQWGLYAAGAIVVSVPVVAFFVVISRYLVSGLTLGSVKG